MADDKHYVPGDFYRICERTGFKVRAFHTRKEWTGRIVRDQSFEMRHPQDFVRGVEDNQAAPEPRPRQTDSFLGPLLTTITLNALAQATTLNLVTSLRMGIGDKLNVMLDTGVAFVTFVQTIPTGTSVTISPPLPFRASSGNYVVDTSAVAQANIG